MEIVHNAMKEGTEGEQTIPTDEQIIENLEKKIRVVKLQSTLAKHRALTAAYKVQELTSLNQLANYQKQQEDAQRAADAEKQEDQKED